MTLVTHIPLTMDAVDHIYDEFYLKVNGDFVGPFYQRMSALAWYRNRVKTNKINECSLWAAKEGDVPKKFLYTII